MWRGRARVNGRPNSRLPRGGILAVTANLGGTILRVLQRSLNMEINPIKSEITALRARFDALRGYL